MAKKRNLASKAYELTEDQYKAALDLRARASWWVVIGMTR
jgi:hypothetical protein